jgi:hypothetical protein
MAGHWMQLRDHGWRPLVVVMLLVALPACNPLPSDGRQRPTPGTDTPIAHERGRNSTVASTGPTVPPSDTATRTSSTPMSELRRPLTAPQLSSGDPCPRTEALVEALPNTVLLTGANPVFASPFGPDGARPIEHVAEDGWILLKTVWFADAEYDGPLLVRGRQLDGDNPLLFASSETGVQGEAPQVCVGRTCYQEILLPGRSIPSSEVRAWGGYTIVRAPGCYAFQVDGIGISTMIVVQITDGSPDDRYALPQSLPRQLRVWSVVHIDQDMIRVALTGLEDLWIRIDIGSSSQRTPRGESGCLASEGTSDGRVCWEAHPRYGWPQTASWDDGQRQYRLTVLYAQPHGWSAHDLQHLADALARQGR